MKIENSNSWDETIDLNRLFQIQITVGDKWKWKKKLVLVYVKDEKEMNRRIFGLNQEFAVECPVHGT